MSDDRLFHKRLGHSVKVNQLTPLEEIAWSTIIRQSDDFGVLPYSPLELKAAHDRFANLATRVVEKMIERVVEIDLHQTFTHQGRLYLYQRDWQDWQKRRNAQRSIHPRVPDAELSTCTDATKWLHTIWPAGKLSRVFPKGYKPGGTSPGHGRDSGGTNPGRVPDESRPSRARDRVLRDHVLTDRVLTADDARVADGHPNCHPPCQRICLTRRQHSVFLERFGNAPDAEEQLELFYAQTRAALPDEPFADKPWDFWQERFEQRFGVKHTSKNQRVTTAAYPDYERTQEMLADLRKARENRVDPETAKRLLAEARNKLCLKS